MFHSIVNYDYVALVDIVLVSFSLKYVTWDYLRYVRQVSISCLPHLEYIDLLKFVTFL